MAPLVLAALRVRRTARAIAPLACVAALGAFVAADASSPLAWPYALVALGVFLPLFFVKADKRIRAIEASPRLDLEVGLLLVIGAFGAVVRADGNLDGRAYPAVFVAIALVSAFSRSWPATAAVLFAAGLELVIRRPGLDFTTLERVLPHLGFMALFAALNAAILRAEITRVRKASQSHVEAEMERLRDDARTYRLLAAPSGSRARSREEDEDLLARSGAEEIHQAVRFALKLLRESLALHTTILLWRNDAGTQLRICELVTDSPDIAEGPFLAGDGVIGATLSRRAPVSFAGLKPSYKLPYYDGPCPVRSVCALPIYEHGVIRGMLVVDRVEDRAFSPREQELVEEAGRYAVRVIQNERVFAQLERAKDEQSKLYRAAEALGAATTEPDVVNAGVRSAREIASVDFAAVTLFDEATKTHEIRAVSGDRASELMGQRFRHNGGLVSMVVENRHPLPYRGEYDEKHQVVFTRRVTPPVMPSLVVLPLLVHDNRLGTLVLGSSRRGAFNDAARNTLEVIASHMAVSLSNARMVRRLEELATMDGLTGLLNKRAMLEVAEAKIASARRFGRPLSVLVTDIDFFKRVNDTYGHDVGDVIIKGLGDILRRAKRSTDSVARFGGEEFVVICEETDERGALLLAERVREELERTVFHAGGAKDGARKDATTVSVTCSVGVATFPRAGSTWDELFKAADEALYTSKRGGRNRSTVHGASANSAA